MKSLVSPILYHFLKYPNIAIVLAGFIVIALSAQCLASDSGNAAAAMQDDDDSDDWMFDKSTYSHNLKTGQRVDQFKKEKTPYRDPNAFFDSSIVSFSMFGDFFGGFYDNYNPLTYFSMLSEYMGNYFYGNDSDKYYPYDGDPNDEEQDNDAMIQGK
jgi:hypothetical protein